MSVRVLRKRVRGSKRERDRDRMRLLAHTTVMDVQLSALMDLAIISTTLVVRLVCWDETH